MTRASTIQGQGTVFSVTNPATGHTARTVVEHGPDDVEKRLPAAVQAIRSCGIREFVNIKSVVVQG